MNERDDMMTTISVKEWLRVKTQRDHLLGALKDLLAAIERANATLEIVATLEKEQ